MQLSAGQDADAAAADGDTDAVLLTDAETAFNSISRKVMLHNLKFTCPIIAKQLTVTQQLWEHMH